MMSSGVLFFWMSDVGLLTLICKHCARSFQMDLHLELDSISTALPHLAPGDNPFNWVLFLVLWTVKG